MEILPRKKVWTHLLLNVSPLKGTAWLMTPIGETIIKVHLDLEDCYGVPENFATERQHREKISLSSDD